MIENVKIRPFSNDDLNNFKTMVSLYFRNDFKIEISDKGLDKMCNEISNNSILGISPLDMLIVNEKVSGFICYQIDSPNSDWCEREGWGFIRELFVYNNIRGTNLGQALVNHAEDVLYSKGVKNIYLTSDEGEKFWLSCGYIKTDKVSSINKDSIYEK